MKVKTYKVIVDEKVSWALEVEATSHKNAGELAIFKVAHNEHSHFPMVGSYRYSVGASSIKKEK